MDSLPGNRIGPSGAAALAEKLPQNTTLTWLSLAFNGLGPEVRRRNPGGTETKHPKPPQHFLFYLVRQECQALKRCWCQVETATSMKGESGST